MLILKRLLIFKELHITITCFIREGKRDRDRQRQTETDGDRERKTEKGRQTNRQTDRETRPYKRMQRILLKLHDGLKVPRVPA